MKLKFIAILATSALILLACDGAFALLVGVFPHDVFIRLFTIPMGRNENAARQTQWKNLKITHYQITLERDELSHSMGVFCPGATLEIKDDIVVTMIEPIIGLENGECQPFYQENTIDRLFQLVSVNLQANDALHTQLFVQYDSTYGYIRYLELAVVPLSVDSLLYGDEAMNRIGHPMRLRINVTNFQPLP